MKKLALIAIVLLAFSCKKESEEPFGKPAATATEVQTPEALGKEIFEGKGNCVACHQVDQKVIGPSIKEIAKIYKDKNGNMVNFLKGESEAIVDPAQFPVMQANLAITKTFTEDELKAVEAYINSNLK
ncbi:c-type cytochrome [Flavobacterium aquicola]|uniref:Cytochrome c n=1 Tax=Flavobacterium aquicola TaxID=1682742 RepID=A0A3E0E3E6_9FLAO|nr:c-type cytochrome [Flavobacterium aquicola]REG92253.1 cytochrome c [Flavobacterium aquicola]